MQFKCIAPTPQLIMSGDNTVRLFTADLRQVRVGDPVLIAHMKRSDQVEPDVSQTFHIGNVIAARADLLCADPFIWATNHTRPEGGKALFEKLQALYPEMTAESPLVAFFAA